jgi:hypothetical protein
MKTSFFSCIIFSILLSVTVNQALSQPVVLGDPSPQPLNPHFYWTKYPGAVRYSAEVFMGITLIWFNENIPDTQITINNGGFQAGTVYYFRVKAYSLTDSTQWSLAFPFWIGYTGIVKISTNVPSDFSLSQNYPNPFNPSTKIKFEIPQYYSPLEGRKSGLTEGKGDVKLIVYDVLGNVITALVNEYLSPGTYEAEWNASNYASGIYYYRLTFRQAGSSTGDFSETKKMILLK